MKVEHWNDMEKAIMAASQMERIMAVLLTLAQEYQDNAINKDRFAKRTYETLRDYAKLIHSSPSAALDQEKK